MQKCRICGDTDFYKEAGYFFCQTCQTQHEDIREEILDIRVDNTTRLRKIRVKRLRSTSSGEEVGWTTWELYNFVLIGLTNELLELGVPSDIKLTILQLWATYLGKVDVAFISTNRKCVPKLARQYRKRDAEVIYGKVQVQKRSRRRKRPMSGTSTSIVSGGRSEGSSMKELNRNKRLLVSADYNRYLQSQGSSDADGVSSTSQSRYSFDTDSIKSLGSVGRVKFSYHAKEEARKIKKLSKRVHRSQRTNYEAKYTTTEYRTSPYVITPMRLWAILYLALRIHDQPIQLGDMLRYGREGHLSYYKLDHLVPPEVTLTPKERNILMQNVEITHKGMRRNIANMAKFLGVHNMLRPNFSSLVSRYCQELGLPRGIQLYTERIVALSPPKMEFDVKKSYCPNYEGRAMAFIVVVLKTLLALDGMTEYQISRVAEKINSVGKVQMDASMMDGLSFKCGSVAAVSDIEHPITLAKYVMNNFPNSIFVGEGAKNLAKYANINWLSDGNMVAPAARIAYLVDQTGALEPDMDIDNIAQLDMTQDSLDTVGCVAYDGYSIAAGTTTGGLNRKLVGRVGDSPLLGCGTYATKYTGCSLTGHGESIAKLGLAREIVEDIERGYRSEEALHKHLNNMLKSHEQVGGGIILQCDGRWATYFTSSKMPYAVIENDLITYGARLYEERREMYNSDGNSCDCEYPNIIAIDRGLLSEKLFSFQEWQRYIECRKIILVHAHYPTKMKYSPESVEVDDLYLKFIKFLNSKSNREEPEVKNTKGYLPEELAHALAKYVSSLNVQNVSPEAIDIFPPSLTPLHSYLQQLLDHPLYDIPMIVHKDFFLTKVGYMTKPNVLMELAKQCDIQLKIMDANLHFLEKHVPPFEQPRMPSVEKLNQKIEVQDDTSEILKDESGILNNYIDEKTPCTVKVDVTKKQWFEEVQSDVDNSKRENYAGEDFLFTETLPNGRLAIRTDIGVVEKEENSVPSDNGGMFSAILDRKFCDKYGIELSSKEKESISKLDKRKPNSLRKLARNSKGHFVKPNIAREKTNQDKSESTPENVNFVTNSQTSAASETCTRRESAMESDAFDLGSLDLNEADIKNGFCDLDNYFNLSDISFFAELDDAVPQTDCKKDLLYFFQPFKDYWIYDCIFSRVKSKNFAIFEKSLPRTFRWLLNECALTVEMTTMDLYQELCLIEAYYSQILIPGLSGDNKSKQVNEILKNKLNIILSKW